MSETKKNNAARKKAEKKYLEVNASKNSSTLKFNVQDAKKQNAERKKEIDAFKPKGKLVEVTAISDNLAGKYGLPYSKGVTFKVTENQAKELVENKDASLFFDAKDQKNQEN
jgi:hypothetical protein